MRKLTPSLALLALMFGGSHAVAAGPFTITIDPDAYGERFEICAADTCYGLVYGSQDLDLPVGTHQIKIGSSSFPFTVETDGSVTGDGVSATGSGATLTFENTPVNIHVNGYAAPWQPWLATTHSGDETLFLVPGTNLAIAVGGTSMYGPCGGTWMRLAVAADGSVSTTTPDSLTIIGTTDVHFNTQLIDVDTNGFSGMYNAGAPFGPLTSGSQALYVVKGQAFHFLIRANQWFRGPAIKVDAAGALENCYPGRAWVDGSKVTFRTGELTLYISSGSEAKWQFSEGWTLTGITQAAVLDSLVAFQVQVPGVGTEWQRVTVGPDCELDPETFELLDNTWTLTCNGISLDDADADGVADGDDNCPGDVNPGQGDADEDGIGDPCDLCEGDDTSGDTDSDGFCDDIDVCPGDLNPGQEDADHDGVGDVCELDVDEDGTIDDDDNCPTITNTDQSNSDDDGFGDACDDDDDGDAIDDSVDNCPLLPNPDQDDTDSDGQGDACDGDDDDDGVLDEDDACPATPMDQPYGEDGCSGEQLIKLTCGEPADHSNHGQYVRCVSHAGNGAVAGGLLSNRQRAAIVRTAAKAK